MNGVQTRFKCKLDVKRCKRFVFPPSSLLPRSNALKTKAIRYFQTDRTLTRIVSPPLPAMQKKDIRAESVRFETVKFRPSKAFKKYVRHQMELERIDKKTSAKKPAVAKKDRKQMMLTFLEANVCITRAEYARLTRVTDRCASSDLQEFLTEGVIRKRGGGRSVVYIKNQ